MARENRKQDMLWLMLATLTSLDLATWYVGPNAAMADLCGVVFLFGALVDRGSMKRWWQLAMPIGAVLLLTRGALAELSLTRETYASALSGLHHMANQAAGTNSRPKPLWVLAMHQSVIPFFSLIGAVFIKTLSQSRADACDVQTDTQKLFKQTSHIKSNLMHVETEMKSILFLIKALKFPETTLLSSSVSSLELEQLPQLNLPGAYLDSKLSDHDLAFGRDDMASADSKLEDLTESVSEARVRTDSNQVSLHYPIEDSIPQAELVEPNEIFTILKSVTAEFGARIKEDLSRQQARSTYFLTNRKTRLILTGPSAASVPMMVRAERFSIHKILRSLIAQAIDASTGGEGIVRVGMRVSLSDVVISVEDNGRGLSEAMLEKLASNGVLQNADVERLSLQVVRQQLEQKGATMEVMARLGVGTRIVIEIPRLDAYARMPGAQPTYATISLESSALN